MSKSTGGSGKKKRKDRDSFKSGGTWPRTRGGPVYQPTTGTILHPNKYKVIVKNSCWCFFLQMLLI